MNDIDIDLHCEIDSTNDYGKKCLIFKCLSVNFKYINSGSNSRSNLDFKLELNK